MLLASTCPPSFPPRRGSPPSSDAPRQHTPARLPATTGLAPVERCSSPARAPEPFPPRRGSPPSSDAPRQHAPPNPSRHDGARPRRAMLLASTRPPALPPRRGSSPSSDAPRQHTPPRLPATTGLAPVERCSSPAHARPPSRHDGARPRRAMLLASTRPRTLPATTGLAPVERCSSPARAARTLPPRRGSSPSSDAPRQHERQRNYEPQVSAPSSWYDMGNERLSSIPHITRIAESHAPQLSSSPLAASCWVG